MKFVFDSSGYSMLELLMAVSILAVIFLVVSDFYSTELISYNRNFTKTTLQSDIKQALETVEKDARQASQVEDNSVWTDPNKAGGWQSSLTTPATLVLAEPALDASGNVIFADPTHTSIKTDDVIYFVASDNALYRRTLANPDASNRAKTTCPSASASPSCPVDGKVVENIASMSAAYYDTLNNNIPSAPFSGAYSIQLTMSQSHVVFGSLYTSSLTSQASLRNR